MKTIYCGDGWDTQLCRHGGCMLIGTFKIMFEKNGEKYSTYSCHGHLLEMQKEIQKLLDDLKPEKVLFT